MSPYDLARWEREGRFDIIAAYHDEERKIENEDFLHGYKMLKPCRFLANGEGKKTTCEIYHSRPAMCCKFVPGKSKLCPARPDADKKEDS